MFDELLSHPGVEEEVVLRSRVGFLAFHGGSLEEQTDVIAEHAAELAGASCYTVRLPPELHWHVPSKLVDPAHSPALAALLDHVDTVVAVHGYGRRDMWTTILLGGRNRRLAGHLRTHLRGHLPGYEVIDELDRIPVALRGQHPDNPVNRTRLGGVQLELPPRVRGMGPHWEGHDRSAVPHLLALVDGLAAAATTWRSPDS